MLSGSVRPVSWYISKTAMKASSTFSIASSRESPTVINSGRSLQVIVKPPSGSGVAIILSLYFTVVSVPPPFVSWRRMVLHNQRHHLITHSHRQVPMQTLRPTLTVHRRSISNRHRPDFPQPVLDCRDQSSLQRFQGVIAPTR